MKIYSIEKFFKWVANAFGDFYSVSFQKVYARS